MSAPQASDPEWKHLDDLFQHALDLPLSERESFVRESCGNDLKLYGKLSALLEAAAGDDEFLNTVVQNAAHSVVNRTLAAQLTSGAVFARYIILSEIGSGGMGKVYAAEDPTLKRRIALKMLTAAAAYDHDSAHRFRKEAEAASALNHPNILTIYEVGEWQQTQFHCVRIHCWGNHPPALTTQRHADS
jgi:serine/threonine protein kinase